MKIPRFRPVVILCIAAVGSGLLLMIGCSGGMNSLTNPPPVSAQQGYSTASLSGTYSFNEIGYTNGQLHDGSGTLQFDGNGNVTGTLNEYYVNSSPCQFSITGTYTLSSSASGTSSVTSTSTNSACIGATGTLNLQAGQQGQSLILAETDGQRLNTGTAIRQ